MPGENPSPDSIAPQALPAGTRLGDFELLSVLGAGGFGIVYDARDVALRRRVAIKEYMPGFLAGRTAQGQVTLLSESNLGTFESGLRSFVEEARLLASLDHPSLVKVYQFWKANGTAYFVMPFYEGQTLRRFCSSRPAPLGEATLRVFLLAMLGALDVLHRQNIFHRDIAPDNIILTQEDKPILLDFGSARQTIVGQTQKLTAVVKLGYAPIEQYDDTSIGLQGPWTDLYALGGTLHFAITGRSPPPAQIRMLRDDLPPLASQPGLGISSEFLKIVDWMLALRPEARPQSVDAVRLALGNAAMNPHIDRTPVFDPDATVLVSAIPSTIRADGRGPAAPSANKLAAGAGKRMPKALLAAAIGGVLLAGALVFQFGGRPDPAAPAGSTGPGPGAIDPPLAATPPAEPPPQQPAAIEPATRIPAVKRGDTVLPTTAARPAAVTLGSQAAGEKPQTTTSAPVAAPEPEVKAAADTPRVLRAPDIGADAVSSPLTRCKLDFPGEPVATCLAITCNLPDNRVHAVCVAFQREAAGKQ